VPPGNAVLVALFAIAVALLLLSGWYGARYLDRFRAELPAGAGPAVERRLYWAALNRGYLDEFYDRAIVAPTRALGRALDRFDSAVIDRPPALSAPDPSAAAQEAATWEARFLALRSEDAAGAVALAEPPERLDWLGISGVGASPVPQDHSHGDGPRIGRAAKRASAWSERASDGGGGVVGAVADATAGLAERIERTFFQRAEGHGIFASAANASARLAERVERVFFQSLDTSVLKMTEIIAGTTDAVERIVFQSGVERGVASAAAGAQRALLGIERRLGRPSVIGSILAVALLAVIVGTR